MAAPLLLSKLANDMIPLELRVDYASHIAFVELAGASLNFLIVVLDLHHFRRVENWHFCAEWFLLPGRREL